MKDNATLFVPTLGRIGDQKFLEDLHEANSPLLNRVNLMVIPEEEKGHRKQWYGGKVKLRVLPPEIDCIAKKRKWIAHTCDTNCFYIIDDDAAFLPWSGAADKHVRLSECANQDKVASYFEDYLPELLTENAYVTFSGRFMAKPTIKQHGFLTNASGYCAVLFDTDRAKSLEYNRMMFYNDADALLQTLSKTGLPPIQDLHVIMEKKNTKKMDTTGADVYRTSLLVNDNLTKLVRYQSGRVYGMKEPNAHSIQNRVSISYSNARNWMTLSDRKRDELIQKSEMGLQDMLHRFGLKSPPRYLPFEDRTPRDEIVSQITSEWTRATNRTQRVRRGLFQ